MMYTIYSKSGCIYCDAAMDLMEKNNLEYKEVKVDRDPLALAYMQSNNFKTVPQIYDPEGNHVGGYYDFKKTIEWPENSLEG